MANSSRPKKGQEVKIIAGKYKGQVGKVLSVFPKDDKLIIENINVAKRHMKPNQQNQTGGIISKEKPIHISNVKVIVNA
ncbi:MAG: 50S ribosomal protein L24 [Deltaproteobacteria bacterium TMED126]|nr:50S ribosomal protein L24 [Deltaproteobacteria bacterium TMED126]NSW98665.1 50S ribosomal protein L24 [bacterium]